MAAVEGKVMGAKTEVRGMMEHGNYSERTDTVKHENCGKPERVEHGNFGKRVNTVENENCGKRGPPRFIPTPTVLHSSFRRAGSIGFCHGTESVCASLPTRPKNSRRTTSPQL